MQRQNILLRVSGRGLLVTGFKHLFDVIQVFLLLNWM